MWFIFPQLKALGKSDAAKFFGISDLVEARSYSEHHSLGSRLLECGKAVTFNKGKSATAIMGQIDALKLRSSATLFVHANPVSETGLLMHEILAIFYHGQVCHLTTQDLSR